MEFIAFLTSPSYLLLLLNSLYNETNSLCLDYACIFNGCQDLTLTCTVVGPCSPIQDCFTYNVVYCPLLHWVIFMFTLILHIMWIAISRLGLNTHCYCLLLELFFFRDFHEFLEFLVIYWSGISLVSHNTYFTHIQFSTKFQTFHFRTWFLAKQGQSWKYITNDMQLLASMSRILR